MTKTVLIPTDFSVRSLNLAIEALNKNQNEHLKIILLHGLSRSISISELLFDHPTRRLTAMTTKDFKNARKFIQNTYSTQLVNMTVDSFSGVNQRAFNNYLEGNAIDEIYAQESVTFHAYHQDSFDLYPFIKRCKITTTWVQPGEMSFGKASHNHQLSAVFFSK